MPSVKPWPFGELTPRGVEPSQGFSDPSVPKLANLTAAARAGLRVPPTAWAWADALPARPSPAWPGEPPGLPCIVRSGSPTEDTAAGSNAGRFKSLIVRSPGAYPAAVAEVIAALPTRGGRPLGVVFVQPLVEGGRAGVTFFDGFYYEETSAAGGNQALTAGLDRGEVTRGHVLRGDPHHDWLRKVHAVFGGTIDLEWAETAGGEPVLLQARPALFPVRRCETLSLANHKEILGDPPSPWMTGVLAAVGRPVMRFFERVDPPVAAWSETYSVELGERAWLNFSAFFRLMDRWGLPRTMVTEGVGGEAAGPADAAYGVRQILRSFPVFARLLWACLAAIFGIGRGLRELDAALPRAGTLAEIWRVNAVALEFSVRTNFAIMSLLSVFVRFRRRLGLGQAGRVVTQRMMGEYARLAARPDPGDRLGGLDAWLARYGHRGPLESDPMRPRFSELRALLRSDLARGAAPAPVDRPQPSRLVAALARPLFWLDEVREDFRDRLMRWWQRLRVRILEEAERAAAAGHLDAADDVFLLRGADLDADPATWRALAADRRARVDACRRLDLPATAPRDAIEDILRLARRPPAPGAGAGDGPDRFVGIGLGKTPVVGTAVRASDPTEILGRDRLPESPVLVADTLEPSWAVVFPRFAAVVSELGGELSHASILLREAGIPAVVNARGAFRSIADGDLVRVDPVWGEVRIEARRPAPEPEPPTA